MSPEVKAISEAMFCLAKAMDIDVEDLFPEISDHLFDSRFQQDEVFKYIQALNLKEQ